MRPLVTILVALVLLLSVSSARAYDYLSVSPTHPTWTAAGSDAQFYDGPLDIAIDQNGYVYVVYDSGRVEKFTSDGTHVWEFTNTRCDKASALALDSDGNIYVGSYGTIGSVSEFDPGIIIGLVPTNVRRVSIMPGRFQQAALIGPCPLRQTSESIELAGIAILLSSTTTDRYSELFLQSPGG